MRGRMSLRAVAVRPAAPLTRPGTGEISRALRQALLLLLASGATFLAAAQDLPAPPTTASSVMQDRPLSRPALFAPANLLAWCIVPYDNQHRTPAQRMEMLQRLGFTQYIWDWRQQHLKDLPLEIESAHAAGIRLRGVWIWIDERYDQVGRLGDANRAVFDAVNRAGRPVEFWVGFHANAFPGDNDDARLDRGVAWVSFLRDEARATGSTISLYNHGDWFGEPENQLKIIAASGPSGLGLTYNFHHAHHQISRFATLLPAMLPHLKAVVLNGMKPEGPKILPIGEGTHERAMIRLLAASGYRGPIGILGHVEDADVEVVLQRNLAGLRRLIAP
jgi:sugar phosphate isomerase/epimerase